MSTRSTTTNGCRIISATVYFETGLSFAGRLTNADEPLKFSLAALLNLLPVRDASIRLSEDLMSPWTILPEAKRKTRLFHRWRERCASS
jgi:hypothetical protein